MAAVGNNQFTSVEGNDYGHGWSTKSVWVNHGDGSGHWTIIAEDDSGDDWHTWRRGVSAYTKKVNTNTAGSTLSTLVANPANTVFALLDQTTTDADVTVFEVDPSTKDMVIDTDALTSGTENLTGFDNGDCAHLAITNDGRIILAYATGGALLIRSTGTDRASFASALTLVASGVQDSPTGAGIMKVLPFTDGTDWYTGVLYHNTSEELVWTYIQDGDDPQTSGNWSTPVAVAAYGDVGEPSSEENHFDAACAVLPGSSASTLVACIKDGVNDIYTIRAHLTAPDASWDAWVATGWTDNTGPTIGLDSENGVAYVACGNATGVNSVTAVLYRTSDATTTMSWGGEATLLDADDGGTTLFNSRPHFPDHGCTSDMGMLVVALARGENELWDNLLTISPAAGGSIVPTVMAMHG